MNADQPDLNQLIDLLVDDQLNPSARRALFDRLDAEPGGWRRCACAFLEAQSWHAALAPTAPERAPHQPLLTRPALRRPPFALVGIAATLLAAFSLGWAARGGTTPPGNLVVTAPSDTKSVATESGHGRSHAPPEKDEVERQVVHNPASPEITRTVSNRQAASPWSESVRRKLQQRGFEVEQQQRLLALELKNGRRLTVPVEEVKVRYVGNRTL